MRPTRRRTCGHRSSGRSPGSGRGPRMYETHYGFRESPFKITPDPRFLYLTKSHRDTLAYLEYGVRERKGILVVSGEVGTGKTLMVRTLLNQLPEEIESAVVMNARLEFNELLYLALLDFGAAPKSRTKIDLLVLLQEFLLGIRNRGGTALLVVDEAQTLSADSLEEFRLLSNLETNTEKLLQILLVGQPELKIALQQHSLRQLRQRVPGVCDLSKLPPESIWEYVEHRLHIASEGHCRGLFHREAIDEVARYADGIPRRINQVCDRALLIGYARGEDRIGAPHVREAIQDLEDGFLGIPGAAPVSGRSMGER
ncbi:MAG: AAA family ATPase [Candidatus Eisenbacteria bacterium]|nr:AAA family ATPase [Candidatus Latescibacterota bacterium]MBD3303449.1 AAA family ATPase [Candidatus Eisenbacteria bacterium]